MSNLSGYPTRSFKESQKFLVQDPSTGTASLVLGSDLVDYITPQINSVIAETTRVAAENTDYEIGKVIQTTGATSPGDDFASVYLVVEGGTGDFPMLNGNDLLVIRGDEFLREQLAEDVSTGNGANLVNGAVVYIESVAESISGLSLTEGQKLIATGWHSGTEIGGGDFVARTSEPKSGHGLKGWSPTVPAVSEQSGATLAERTANYLQGVGETDPGGTGLFVRVPKSSVDIEIFGLIEGEGVDNTQPLSLASDYILEFAPQKMVLPNGVVESSEALHNRRGVHVTSRGVCKMIPTGSDRIYKVGSGTGLPILSSDITEGDTSLSFSSAPDVSPGDVILVLSGLSTNSSGGNDISIYKQFFIVRSISGTTVNVYTPADVDQSTADTMQVIRIDCVGGTTENITIPTEDPPFSGPYAWDINAAYQHEFKNFIAASSASFVVKCDLIFFKNCVIQGFNSGASTARDTKRVFYENCDIRTGPTQPTGFSTFIEESPDKVTFDDCDLFGRAQFGASSDTFINKTAICRSSRFYSAGSAVKQVGWYNPDAPSLILDNCEFFAPGQTGAAGVKTILDVSFADSIRVTNCSFPGADADAYTLSLDAVGSFRADYRNNRDANTLGLHSSVTSARSVDALHGKSRVGGSGFVFPATQLPSTDPNTLDDYEEGEFTPTLTTDDVDFTSITYRSQTSGRYIKIGRLVNIQIRLETSTTNTTGATGDVVIGGLPFASQPDGASGERQGFSAFSVSEARLWTDAPCSAAVYSSESRVRLFKRPTAVSDETPVQVSDVTSGSISNVIIVTGTYIVED